MICSLNEIKKKEVIDVDNTDIGVIPILLHVAILPYYVVRVELEYVGVHLEDEDIAGHLNLSLELTPITILNTHTAVKLTIKLVVYLGGQLEERLLKLVKRREGIIKNLLLERRLLDYSI